MSSPSKTPNKDAAAECLSVVKENVCVLADLAATLELADIQKDCVSFQGQGLKLDTAEHAKQVTDAIDACEGMHTLILEGNTIGIPAAKEIGKALESKSKLENAHLKDLFTGRLKTEVPDAVRFITSGISLSNAVLFELDLSDNAFGPIGMKALAPFLQSPSAKDLKVLRLNNNGLGIQGGTILSKCLPLLTSLRVLICGRNRLENDAGTLIAKSLATLTTLEELQMPQNGIRAEGITAIAEAVKANPKLRHLNLNDNTMTAIGGAAIAKALEVAPNIQIINFGDCLLRSAGGVHVLSAILKLPNFSELRDVNLSGNELGGEEVVELVLELTKRPDRCSILKLDLSSNQFGDDTVAHVKSEYRKKDTNLVLTDDEGTASEDENDDNQDDDHDDEVIDVENESAKKESPKKKDLDDLADVLANENTSVDDLCELFVNVSIDSFREGNNSLDEEALKKTEQILESAKKKQRDSFETTNGLLGHLGLLKREDGKKVVPDLRGPFVALTASAKKLNRSEKEVFQLFLGNRPTKETEATGQIKTKLLQQLYM